MIIQDNDVDGERSSYFYTGLIAGLICGCLGGIAVTMLVVAFIN